MVFVVISECFYNSLLLYFILVYIATKNIHEKMNKDVGLPRTEKKKKERKQDRTYFVTETNNSLITDKCITAIPA